jgi:hypothetical protein
MLGRQKTQAPEEVFDLLCRACDDNKLKYEADKEKYIIAAKLQGDDLPISLAACVYPNEEIVDITCGLMFEIPPHRHEHIVSALNDINVSTIMGAFTLNRERNMIFYQLYQTYTGCRITKETMAKLIAVAVGITDKHDGKLKELLPDDWNTMYR